MRLDKSVRQAELARLSGISASYLNLIEHNRRSIGGLLLNRIAEALGTDPATLSDGPEAAMRPVLTTAAASHANADAEIDRVDEFVGRFPGWARLVESQSQETERLNHMIDTLSDKLTHDPFLAAALHEMLSSVTAIRSASGILAGGDVEPEWQARFHRNIFEDAQRLASSGETLVRYLESGEDDKSPTLPTEEFDVWLQGRVGIDDLEQGATPEEIVDRATELRSPSAREMAREILKAQLADIKGLPSSTLIEAVSNHSGEPVAIADTLGLPLPVILRRLAMLPESAFPDQEPRGFAQCDGSGALTVRKPLPDFDLPRYGTACPLWPLFQALQRPGTPIRSNLQLASREGIRFQTFAFAEISHPQGYDGPSIAQAWMLFFRNRSQEDEEANLVGTSCRVCPREDCAARHEPSLILQDTTERQPNGF